MLKMLATGFTTHVDGKFTKTLPWMLAQHIVLIES